MGIRVSELPQQRRSGTATTAALSTRLGASELLHSHLASQRFLLLRLRDHGSRRPQTRAQSERAGTRERARRIAMPEPACSLLPARSYSSHSPATPTWRADRQRSPVASGDGATIQPLPGRRRGAGRFAPPPPPPPPSNRHRRRTPPSASPPPPPPPPVAPPPTSPPHRRAQGQRALPPRRGVERPGDLLGAHAGFSEHTDARKPWRSANRRPRVPQGVFVDPDGEQIELEPGSSRSPPGPAEVVVAPRRGAHCGDARSGRWSTSGTVGSLQIGPRRLRLPAAAGRRGRRV